jgi:4-amino-4-deoxychorismate lyase
MDRWLINGVLTESLSADDRGLAYGDGLFETLAVRNGQCRFLDDHLARLQAGCDRLQIPLQVGQDLPDDVQRCLSAGGAGATDIYGTLKIIVTRGCGPRGYAPPKVQQPTVLVGFAAAEPAAAVAQVAVRYCATRISRNRSLAGLKTLNRLEQVLARMEWADQPGAWAEGLMLNDRDEVVCGTMSNLFAVRGQQLMTPPLDESGIAGVMRARVIRCAKDLGIEVSYTALRPADLQAVDGIFLTNTLIGMWPVTALELTEYGSNKIIDDIRIGLANMGVEECAG